MPTVVGFGTFAALPAEIGEKISRLTKPERHGIPGALLDHGFELGRAQRQIQSRAWRARRWRTPSLALLG